MPERDETLVTINLDAPRPYRDRETMQVTTIGPGEATVPRYVAQRWGIEEQDAPLAEPWEGYADLPVDEVRQRLRPLTLEEREAVRAYESATRQRKGVLNALNALEEERNATEVEGNAE